MTAPNLVVYKQPCFPQHQLSMKKAFPYAISATKRIQSMFDELARAAKMRRSEYFRTITEELYDKPKRRVVLMDEEQFEKFQAAQSRSAKQEDKRQ